MMNLRIVRFEDATSAVLTRSEFSGDVRVTIALCNVNGHSANLTLNDFRELHNAMTSLLNNESPDKYKPVFDSGFNGTVGEHAEVVKAGVLLKSDTAIYNIYGKDVKCYRLSPKDNLVRSVLQTQDVEYAAAQRILVSDRLKGRLQIAMVNILRGIRRYPHDEEGLEILQSVYGAPVPTLSDRDNIETEAVLSHIWDNFRINGLPLAFEETTLRIFPEYESWFTII